MLEQCGTAESMVSEVVEQAVKTCENLSLDLSDQWQDMMDLRQVLHSLPVKLRLSVSPVKVEREISQLQEMHTGGCINFCELSKKKKQRKKGRFVIGC